MKTGKQKAYRLAVLLLSVLLLAAMFPAAAFADGEPEHDGQYYHFSSLDTLEKILKVESEEEVWATEVKDLTYTLREDLTIPTGKKVFFGTGLVTVEPGVTVTVEEDAALFFYAMDLYGTVVNRGDFVQCEPHEGEDYLLRIDGRLINSDWFCYVHAEGLENVENLETALAPGTRMARPPLLHEKSGNRPDGGSGSHRGSPGRPQRGGRNQEEEPERRRRNRETARQLPGASGLGFHRAVRPHRRPEKADPPPGRVAAERPH